jgi:protein-tyrosine phosphatase
MLHRRHLLGLVLAAALSPPVRAAEPVKIVFVDTGNTGRSLMAETLARALAAKAGLAVTVISRGLDVDPFDEAPEANARLLLAERGLDVAAHRARRLEAADAAHADLILTMTPAHAQKAAALYPDAAAKILPLGLYAVGEPEAVPDAYGKPMAAYRAVAAQLDRFLPLALSKAVRTRP